MPFPIGLLPWFFPIFCPPGSLYTNAFRKKTALKPIILYHDHSLAPETSVLIYFLYFDVPEQKARVTYDNILRLSDDPDVNDVIRFLREREIVHFQRFGEAIEKLREKLNEKNVYCMNPAIDI